PGANANIGAEPFQMALLPLLPDASFDFGIGEAQADSALPTRVEQERARRARYGIVGSVGVTEAPTVDSIHDELGHGRSVLIEEDVGVTRHWNAQGRARLARADLGSSQQRLERLAVELDPRQAQTRSEPPIVQDRASAARACKVVHRVRARRRELPSRKRLSAADDAAKPDEWLLVRSVGGRGHVARPVDLGEIALELRLRRYAFIRAARGSRRTRGRGRRCIDARRRGLARSRTAAAASSQGQ